jgi:hypothetical protein
MTHRTLAFLIIQIFSIHSINAHSFQAKDTQLDNNDNFITLLQQELRSPHYRKKILPNDFSNFYHVINFGTTNNQPPAYLRSVVKMFSNMLKSSQYVNAYAFSHLLERLPVLVNPYFTLPLSTRYITNSTLRDASFADRFASTAYNALYSKFSTEYESFRQNPDLFLKNMSNDIVAIAQEEVAQEQVRQSIIRFCEIALSKLIWNPAEQENTWKITKKIAEQLATLLEHNIIDDSNDLDDLYWTLITRYCYFMEVAATDLNETFYNSVKNDISSQKIIVFQMPEQDSMIESKLSYMQGSLMDAEVRAYGHRYGLLRE